jgi:hypothetical protein
VAVNPPLWRIAGLPEEPVFKKRSDFYLIAFFMEQD